MDTQDIDNISIGGYQLTNVIVCKSLYMPFDCVVVGETDTVVLTVTSQKYIQ